MPPLKKTDHVKARTNRSENSRRENSEARERDGVARQTAKALGQLIAQGDPEDVRYRNMALEESVAAAQVAWDNLLEKQGIRMQDERDTEEARLNSGMHYYRNQGQYENMAINDAVESRRTITLQNPETGERKEFSQENPTGVTLHDS